MRVCCKPVAVLQTQVVRNERIETDSVDMLPCVLSLAAVYSEYIHAVTPCESVCVREIKLLTFQIASALMSRVDEGLRGRRTRQSSQSPSISQQNVTDGGVTSCKIPSG